MTILSLGCSNKPVEKEIKMPMLFDNRGQAEKEVYKFGSKGLIKWKKMCAMQYAKIQALKTSVYSFQFLSI